METIIIDSLRWMHIIAGSLALLSGPVAMLNQDGGRLHRQSGKIYFWSMLVIFVTSIVLSVLRENWFLFMVGIFSCYLVLTGYRALSLKMLHKGQKATTFDWIILAFSVLAGAGLLLMGGWLILAKGNTFGLVPLAFGGVLTSGVIGDYKRFTVPPKEKNHWLIKHIIGMMGGYIATITAFLVQNINLSPAFITWLLPSLIIAPFISYTVRKFKKGKGKVVLP